MGHCLVSGIHWLVNVLILCSCLALLALSLSCSSTSPSMFLFQLVDNKEGRQPPKRLSSAGKPPSPPPNIIGVFCLQRSPKNRDRGWAQSAPRDHHPLPGVAC